MLQFDEDVLQCFENNPSISTNTVDRAVGVNCHLMWNVEGQKKFYPFHWQKVQALGPTITFVETNLLADLCMTVQRSQLSHNGVVHG